MANLKPLTLICINCKQEHQTKASNALYCKKPECQRAKQRSWLLKNSHRPKQQRGSYNKTPASFKNKLANRPCTWSGDDGTPCKNKTGKNYFFCPLHHGYVDDIGMHEAM